MILEADIPVRNLQDRFSNKRATKSGGNLQGARKESKKNDAGVLEVSGNESDCALNLSVRKMARDGKSLVTHICMELGNNESAEEDNSLHGFLNKTDISKELKLDGFSEKYCEAVSTALKPQIGL